MIQLRGMTWNHPRGYDPMIACSRIWQQETGVAIEWDRRSLQDFESYPVDELATEYDLIVIDHPHMGQVVAKSCLVPLDTTDHSTALLELARSSVGPSFASYTFDAHQWALPIDAAAQVQAFRPDRVAAPVKTWQNLLDAAHNRRVLLPLRPPHSLLTFMSLTANLGADENFTQDRHFISLEAGCDVFERLAELAALGDPQQFEMDPIAALETLSRTDSPFDLIPFVYGYVSYATEGFRPARLGFADIPSLGEKGPLGSTLGGTGIAISIRSDHVDEAAEFAFWVASEHVQSGPFAGAGGQPGHNRAWTSGDVNATANGFYRDTSSTLELAFVRPRHNGYMAFQQRGSELINSALVSGLRTEILVSLLNDEFEASFK